MLRPRAEPRERQPEPLPRPVESEPDWAAIDARIADAVAERITPPRETRREQIVAAEPPRDTKPAPPNRPMTASEASVIGKIGAARRPTMIFGTRLR